MRALRFGSARRSSVVSTIDGVGRSTEASGLPIAGSWFCVAADSTSAIGGLASGNDSDVGSAVVMCGNAGGGSSVAGATGALCRTSNGAGSGGLIEERPAARSPVRWSRSRSRTRPPASAWRPLAFEAPGWLWVSLGLLPGFRSRHQSCSSPVPGLVWPRPQFPRRWAWLPRVNAGPSAEARAATSTVSSTVNSLSSNCMQIS